MGFQLQIQNVELTTKKKKNVSNTTFIFQLMISINTYRILDLYYFFFNLCVVLY